MPRTHQQETAGAHGRGGMQYLAEPKIPYQRGAEQQTDQAKRDRQGLETIVLNEEFSTRPAVCLGAHGLLFSMRDHKRPYRVAESTPWHPPICAHYVAAPDNFIIAKTRSQNTN